MRWLLPLTAVLVGGAVGLAAFTFGYAKGYSYLTSDPEACANCHIMDEHYAAWLASSHTGVAGCNDCHTPHTVIEKYMVKARNGYLHSLRFTTGEFPYPLQITAFNHEVVENACRDCHARLAAAMNAGTDAPPDEVLEHSTQDGVECTHCHRHVGHWVR